ncbi:MAG: hypothetical protein ABWW65_05530 [Thermoprotei archaeon]
MAKYFEQFNTKNIKPVMQRIKMKSALEYWSSDTLPVAKYTWVYGPKKPRDQIREQEIPDEKVDIQTLVEKGLITLLDTVEISTITDVEKLSNDADAYIVGDMEDWLTDEELLEAIARKGKPLIAEWDHWGYSIHGRLSKFRLNRFRNVKHIVSMGSNDIYTLIKALRAIRYLKTLRILYIGEYPPRSVAVPNGLTLKDVEKKFGLKILKTSFDEYVNTVENIPLDEAKKVSSQWLRAYNVADHLKSNLAEYAKIYLGIKKLLEKYEANALTVECPALPRIKYVPCLAFSLLLDEGIPAGCEADLPALLTMSILMAASNDAALMGNLNENVTHWDIEHNIVTINHDVVPPSYACSNCRYYVKDYHNMKIGTTSYTELEPGLRVTIAGMHWNMDKLWATRGEVASTHDTVHCRITIRVRVDNAKRVSRYAFGHHVVLIRGDYTEILRTIAEFLNLEFYEF